MLLIQTKNKPIKYLLGINSSHQLCAFNHRADFPTLEKYLEIKNEENRGNCSNKKSVSLSYNPTIFPFLQLKQLTAKKSTLLSNNVKHKNSTWCLDFIVKRHSRSLKPYTELRFMIPKVNIHIDDLFSNLDMPRVYIQRSKYSKILAETKYALEQTDNVYNFGWIYGNVYNDGNVCWGSTNNVKSLIEVIQTYISTLKTEHVNIDISMYMQYIYSEFFDTVFNRDLRVASLAYLFDIKHKPTLTAVNERIYQKFPTEFNTISNPLVYIKRTRQNITKYITIEDILLCNEALKGGI